jgi:hypothetical protein
MRDRILGHMRSNVIGYLALFVALGGGAYAAAKIDAGDIERNAVRSKHIKKQQVKPSDVKNDSLAAADIDEGSLGLPIATKAVGLTPQATLVSSTTSFDAGTIAVSGPSRLMVSGTVQLVGNGNPGAEDETGDAPDRARCTMRAVDESADTQVGLSEHSFNEDVNDVGAATFSTMSLDGGADVTAGDYTILVGCNDASSGNPMAEDIDLLIWAFPV